MSYAEDMCAIVVDHADEKVRYFVRAFPETGERDVLYLGSDDAWGDKQEELIDRELEEFATRESYAEQMDAGEVTQLIKVADDSVLFTGFIEDEVVVVHFERGILGYLPDIVDDFNEYMMANDIDFTSLSVHADAG